MNVKTSKPASEIQVMQQPCQCSRQELSFSGLPIIRCWRQTLRALLLAVGCLSAGMATADTRQTALDTLVPTAAHKEAIQSIAFLMQRYHYSRVAVDDDLSSQIFDRFLDSFDRQKAFFLASDIKDFEQYRLSMDDSIRDAELNLVFDIFKRFRVRVEERSEFARQLLDSDFDFTIDESYTFNREDAPWPQSKQVADELWRKRVKNDVLNLRLAERSSDEVKETLTERYQRMERRVSQLSPNDVFQTFINAYTTSVEPHTSYFSPRSSEEFQINMSLSLQGIGAALRTENEYTVIQSVITGGPAAMSEQLSAEDRIIGVGQGEDDEIVDVVSWPLGDVVDLIRGPKGSTVRLSILVANAPEGSLPTTITLVRDEIKLEEQAAKSSVVDVLRDETLKRIGVIDLPTFYLDNAALSRGEPDFRSTTRDVKRLVEELMESEGGIDGLIVDLRGNGGGSLYEATRLTGLFIKSGPVVQIRGANGDMDAEVDTDPTVAYSGPLAVLVDRNSASASEIFAGAIQDYGRGVLVGEPTFGKGTVQTVAPLDDQGALGQLKFTMAKFFRVSGDSNQYTGVIPDVLFPTALDSDAQGERGLDNALAWSEVAATRFDAWTDKAPDYSYLQPLHEARYQSNDSFTLLLEELEEQRIARAERDVTLLEKSRQEEFNARSADREKRLALYRLAFGASSGIDEDSELAVTDIILEEAAQVLNDIIGHSSPEKP